MFFKDTKMFTSRVHSIKIDNSSYVQIDYAFEFFDEYSGTTNSGYFSVTPSEGVLHKESSKEFLIKFSPTECDKRN